MRKLLAYLKEYKKECVLAPLFKMLEASFELIVPLVVAAMIDVGIAQGDRAFVWRMSLILAGLGAIGLACSITAQYFAAKAATGFATKLRHALFARVQGMAFSEMDQIGASTLITRMTSDVNQVQAGVNLVLRLFLRSPFIVFGAMVMAFMVDAKAALIFAVVIPLLSVVVFGIMLVSIPLYKKVQERLDAVTGMTRENLAGVRVIRAFHREAEEEASFGEGNQKLTDMQNFVGRIAAFMNPVTYVIVNGALIVLLLVGGVRVDAGALTQGEVVALVNYMSQILVELVKLANLIINVTKAVACGNRIEDVLSGGGQKIVPNLEAGGRQPMADSRLFGAAQDSPSSGTSQSGAAVASGGVEVAAGGKELVATRDCPTGTQGMPIQTGGTRAASSGIVSGMAEAMAGSELPSGEVPAVEFRHVSLTYQNAGDKSLSDISFTAWRGETIGIIGGTGSGKSSLVRLIPRFYEATEGQVLVGGVDVRAYGIRELRDLVGVVPQHAVLFAGTLRENLRWGKEDATEEEMLEALGAAQALDILEGREGGLDCEVAQGGSNFSGGQRQRLTIARALVRKPQILILDDSSSALDYATDAKLRAAISEMAWHPVVFLVSQRTASICHADRILVLEEGEAVGIGTHEELLGTCGVYREIYESQNSRAAR